MGVRGLPRRSIFLMQTCSPQPLPFTWLDHHCMHVYDVDMHYNQPYHRRPLPNGQLQQ